jgi:hypothetical protein
MTLRQAERIHRRNTQKALTDGRGPPDSNDHATHDKSGAEGIRTPDPLDANEVRYQAALQPRTGE